jgi:hypothetical protein
MIDRTFFGVLTFGLLLAGTAALLCMLFGWDLPQRPSTDATASAARSVPLQPRVIVGPLTTLS